MVVDATDVCMGGDAFEATAQAMPVLSSWERLPERSNSVRDGLLLGLAASCCGALCVGLGYLMARRSSEPTHLVVNLPVVAAQLGKPLTPADLESMLKSAPSMRPASSSLWETQPFDH